ncbi:hypothetical protein C487_09459 [Natrinema pallidum DSM 3751]|uniref:Uncharacterized protein n=1 Tax=Natrinema pallidum DSM 3751 TaxID=1227495 RepID=L9YVT3_9EURY|nr:hypothetical protein [Natrinema pallidum]ELY78244.1 hypothetical protein C487_09459 [Natrinema pallidum DSM 3751]
MQDKHNICGDRIDYKLPTGVDESQADRYRSAAQSAEDALAIIAEIQDDRKNESGEICEPVTETTINTIREINHQYLMPALSTLAVLERDQK